MTQMIVSWDAATGLACFRQPGGFVQLKMPLERAEAIARSIGAVFFISEES